MTENDRGHSDRAPNLAALFAPQHRCYSGAEDLGVLSIVVAELKFRNVERQVFLAHLVEHTDHAALQDRPNPSNRVCVNRPLYKNKEPVRALAPVPLPLQDRLYACGWQGEVFRLVD